MKPIPSADIEVAKLELWIARTKATYDKSRQQSKRRSLANLLTEAQIELSKLRAAILVSRLKH